MYDFEEENQEILQLSLEHAKVTGNLRLARRIEAFISESETWDD